MAGLEVWRQSDGLKIIDTQDSALLILGSALIGGPNQAQSGSFGDGRLTLGTPWFLVTSVEVTGFVGYRPNVSFSGTTVTWSWPPQYSGNAYPRTRFIYGVR
ncbi:hypothetical protein [Sphingomonas sp. R1]|uniref:hypothetical protein n=1 Tax=Sphingomonas sp. R1 TaxID=399176 RepID=UPI002224EA35|nr:hypothetical protein [Sphingomonas sp. R1]UYY77488.1 hypothetical protein OIM94_00295 [Sphingomonas sp. R1]